MLIAFDNLDRFVGPIVSQVASRAEAIGIAAIKAIGIGHARPQEPIDGVKINFGVDYIRIVFGEV